jgi:hypothetical protein
MTAPKITLEDFDRVPALRDHSRRSKDVARALDAKADSLPYSKVFTSYEFEEFLNELTPKRFEILRLASKGRLLLPRQSRSTQASLEPKPPSTHGAARNHRGQRLFG